VVKYFLEIKQSAQKELDALDDALFGRIDRKILALSDNPRPAGCKKLKGYKDQWRVRVGDWRVLLSSTTLRNSSLSLALHTAARFTNNHQKHSHQRRDGNTRG
jgi:mRNA interferase RelE/StbE